MFTKFNNSNLSIKFNLISLFRLYSKHMGELSQLIEILDTVVKYRVKQNTMYLKE